MQLIKQMYEDQHQENIWFIKNQYRLIISIRNHKLNVVAESLLIKNHVLKGAYSFDVLPELLKEFGSIQEIYNFLQEIKNTDDLQIANGALEIKISLSLKVKKTILLTLEAQQTLNEVKLKMEIKRLTMELANITKEARKWKQTAERLQIQLDQHVKSHNNSTKSYQHEIASNHSSVEQQIKIIDDDFDLFGANDDEKVQILKKIQKEQAEKQRKMKDRQKAKQKNLLVFDVKIYEVETNLDKLAKEIKANIYIKGLLWSFPHERIHIGFGIYKLRLTCIVQNDVSTQDIVNEIGRRYGEDVQSVDIVQMYHI